MIKFKIKKILFSILFIIPILPFSPQNEAYCFNINSKLSSKIDNALASDSEISWVDVIRRRPRVYFAATFKNLNYSFDKVYELLNDYNNMLDVFEFIYKLEKIETDTQYTENGTFYFETRAGFF